MQRSIHWLVCGVGLAASLAACAPLPKHEVARPAALQPVPATPAPSASAALDPACVFAIPDDAQQRPIERVTFAFNSAQFADHPAACCALDGVAQFLRATPEIRRVAIEVHSDERGNDTYNLQLTRQRAMAVAFALVQLGVAPSRVVPVGMGEYCPLDPSHTVAAWEKNRRITLTILRRDATDTPGTVSCGLAPPGGAVAPKDVPLLVCKR